MNLQQLINDARTSLARSNTVNRRSFDRLVGHMTQFGFWPSDAAGAGTLWSHQTIALGLVAAYLNANRELAVERIANEAALVKMPTGTGKSAVITVLCRCLPAVRRVLVLTPREALTDQLYRYVRAGFWQTMGYEPVARSAIFEDDGTYAGAPVPAAHVTKLLPSAAASILDAAETQERLVLVGTLQALDQIRRRSVRQARNPAEEAAAQIARDLLLLISGFDLVIVDEGHYEPAISWSRAIRDADLPTVLFSATPYRNDYKSFRVRGRFVFNQPVQEALDARVIRRPVFTSLALAPAPPTPAEPTVVRPAGRESEDTVRVTPVSVQERADVTTFVAALVRAVEAMSTVPGVPNPKVIVRADDRAKLELLQDEIERVSAHRALLIHHGQERNDPGRRRYVTVKAAYAQESSGAVSYWLHQTKLLEGVDDPSFVAVAIYDGFGNARQLIQQIGRVLRSSDPERGSLQEARVFAAPARLADIESSWGRYRLFEEYCAERTEHVVTNEAALPDRLLRDMPDLQYVEGEFRPRFMLDGALTADDIRLPASAAVFEVDGRAFDKQAVGRELAEAVLNRDRFQPIPISGLPDNAAGVAYYGWRTSPLLTKQFFPEWTLGVCIMVRAGDLVFAHDTEGIVFDGGKLGLGRMAQQTLACAFPPGADGNAVRLARISAASLDMSESAIRTQAIRTHSFETTLSDMLDPGMVPTSAYGFIGGRGRYLGFARARIRDAFERPRTLPEYVVWAEEVCAELAAVGRARNPVFNRYAQTTAKLAESEAEPKSILLDLGGSFNEFLDDRDDATMRRSLIDADHDDLCADVTDGAFTVTIDGQQFDCRIAYNSRTGRYRIASTSLDAHFRGRTDGSGRRSASTFTQMLNREQAFRIIPQAPGMIYAGGHFHRPRGFDPLPDGSIAQLHNVVAVPALADIKTEKGEDIYPTDRAGWRTGSCFGLMEAMALHPAGMPTPPEWGELGTLVQQFDLIVCDDDGQEVGDFLAIDSVARRACIIHAKASSDGHRESITGLEAVGRQALASLAFCSTLAERPIIPADRWDSDVRANDTILTGRHRVFKNSDGLDMPGIVDAVQGALTNRAWSREVWILAARLLDRRHVEASARRGRTNRNWQLLMYLDSLTTACTRGNARLRVFCHDSLPPPTPSSTSRKKRLTAKPARVAASS